MARLVFTLEDGTEIESELDSVVITIGRHPDSTVVLPSPSVSAHHATIKRRGDSYYVQDLATTNGTKLNGVEVEEAKLEEGDRLFFGDVPAILYLGNALDSKNIDPRLLDKEKPKVTSSYDKTTPATIVYQQSSGCAGVLITLVFLAAAFLAGLSLRHSKEHDGFLPQILVEKVIEKFNSKDSAPVIDQKMKDEGKNP